MTDKPLPTSHPAESIGPSLHVGASSATHATWLGPAWAAICGLIASARFSIDGPNLLLTALVLVVADWAWPALWIMLVRTDWRAPLNRWAHVSKVEASHRLPYFQRESPGNRLLNWTARFSLWYRSIFLPMTDVSVPSIIAALTLALVLSVAIGWRALSLTLAVLALTLMGVLRALRFGVDPTSLRALVYGTLPWWLGHTAFASLSVESAGLGLLFGLAYRALMAEGESAPSLIALISPQVVLTLGLFAGSQPLGALIVALAIVAQIALHSFLKSTAFAQRAQIWLMLAMLAAAISLIVSPFSIF